MHFAFIPYGARTEVERLFRDIEAAKFKLRCWKKGRKDKAVWITGQVRLLPFGVTEIIFPREYKDTVLNTLIHKVNTAENRYRDALGIIPKMMKTLFAKGLKLKPISKVETKEKFLWSTENVAILPLGIREDIDQKEAKDMGYKAWWHEAL